MSRPPQKPNPNSVGTFLETIQGPVQKQRPDAASQALLTQLAAHGPQKIVDLQASSGVAFGEFAAALRSMQETGLVKVSGEPGGEIVALVQLTDAST